MKAQRRFALLALAGLALSLALPRAASAVSITLDTSSDGGFFAANPQAMPTLQAAAAVFENMLGDSLDAITPGGGNTWTAFTFDPGNPAAQLSPMDMNVAQDEIIIFVGGFNFAGGTLGLGGPGGFTATGSGAFLNTVVARGQPGALGAPAGRTDFGPWGGSISFDSDTSWHFGTDTAGLDPGESDFFSVAIHELAHVLGFGTSASWDNLINGANEFTGVNSVAAFGGNVPLEAVVPPETTSHWQDGTISDLQETAMDPTLTTGTRKLLTSLDIAGMQDVGWQIVPEPGRGLLVASALVLLAALHSMRPPAPRRRAGDRPRPGPPARRHEPPRSRGFARATG